MGADAWQLEGFGPEGEAGDRATQTSDIRPISAVYPRAHHDSVHDGGIVVLGGTAWQGVSDPRAHPRASREVEAARLCGMAARAWDVVG
jgi:hypothetical protein